MKKEFLGYCKACGGCVYNDSLSNKEKTIYVCTRCNYPNDMEHLKYTKRKGFYVPEFL